MRTMIKLEVTLDADSNAAIDGLKHVLRESPGASVLIRFAIADAIATAVERFAGQSWYFRVESAKVSSFVAPGKVEKKPRKMRRIIPPGGDK